jgi:hypothetical protein
MEQNMGIIEDNYNYYCKTDGDIKEHLPTLKKYAEECETIYELGTRYLVSTWAFLTAKPKKLISVDILDPFFYGIKTAEVAKLCEQEGIEFVFVLGDDLKIDIEEVDLTFIDTIHVYDQVSKELVLYAPKTKKYIILHDTLIPEMLKGVFDFLSEHKEWKMKELFENNNGLAVLERVND